MDRAGLRRDPARGRKLLLVALAVVIIAGLCIWLITLEVRFHEQEAEVVSSKGSTKNPAARAAAKKSPPPGPPATITTTVFRKLAVIGAGAAGMIPAFRVAPKWGAGIVVIDAGSRVGGKIQSYCLTTPVYEGQDLDIRPTCTQTHAENLRGGDVIMRCMASALGVVSVKRGAVGIRAEYRVRGYNTTGNACFGLNAPTGPATCASGLTNEGVAPNGFLNLSLYGSDILNPCGDLDWRSCSYATEYELLAMKQQNINSILPGESFPQYLERLVGSGGVQLYRDVGAYAAYIMFDDLDAHWAVAYLAYDYKYPYGHIVMPQYGPQIIFARMAFEIQATGAQIRLNERVITVESTVGVQAAAYPFKLTTDLGNIVYAERLVSGIQPRLFADLGGDIAATIASSTFAEHNVYQHTCSLNIFFPTKFWEPFSIDHINAGYLPSISANWTLPLGGINRTAVNFQFVEASPPDPQNGLDFVQYISLPERQEGNLVRFFFEDGEECNSLLDLSAGDTELITTEVVRRLRLRLPMLDVPDAVEAYWSNDELSYPYQSVGASYTPTELKNWAVNPLNSATKRMCISSEAISPYHNGWTEGAAESAHYCLGSSAVFSDIFNNKAVANWEKCDAVHTRQGGPKSLQKGSVTGNDLCLLLPGEYHARDFYRNYCGGPSVYDYPTADELFNNTYISSSSWLGVTNAPVYETSKSHGRHSFM